MSNFVKLLKPILDKIRKHSLMLNNVHGSKEYRLFSGRSLYTYNDQSTSRLQEVWIWDSAGWRKGQY